MNKFIIIVLLLIGNQYVKAQGIEFAETDWNSIKVKALQENKIIFLDFYTTWCAPCKQMDLKTYTNDKVSGFFNEKFISVKVQIDSTQSDNYLIRSWYKKAAELSQKYRITAFPSMVFITPEGEFLHKTVGFKDANELIAEASIALDPKKQYSTLILQYENGRRDVVFVKELIKIATNAGKGVRARRIAQDYINNLTEKELFKPENLWLMYETTKSIKDRGFVFFVKNLEEIERLEPKLSAHFLKGLLVKTIFADEVKPFTAAKDGLPDWKKIKYNLSKYGALGDTVFARRRKFIVFDYEIKPLLEEKLSWAEIRKIIIAKKLEKDEEFVFGATAGYYAMKLFKGDNNVEADFAEAGNYYLKNFPSFITIEMLNSNWCWNVFLRATTKNLIQAGVSWAELLINRCNTPTCFDTYANLLYKSGRIQEALRWSARAVKDAPLDEEIGSAYKKMLKGIPTWETSNSDQKL